MVQDQRWNNGGDGDDDDPDGVQRDGGDDGVDLPLREGVSPGRSRLPESFSLSGVFRLVAAAELFSVAPPDLRFP